MRFFTIARRSARHLAQLEIWVVIVSVTASLVWRGLLPIAVITAILFWFIRWFAYNRPSLRTPGDWSIALLLVMTAVTVRTTSLPEKTLPQVYRLLTGVALYYAIANWCTTTARLRLLISGMIMTGLLLSISAPFSVTWTGKIPFMPPWPYERFELLVSDTIHPNVLAGILVILFPIILAWLFFGWEKLSFSERILSILATIGVVGISALTQSRGAWIALILVFIFLTLFRWRRWGLTAIILTAGLGGAIGISIGAKPIINLLQVKDTVIGSVSRLEIWSRAVYMIQDFPLTGIGMGSFLELIDHLYPFFPAAPDKIFHAHNLFLQITVDLGIPGLVSWLAILMGILGVCWQIYRIGCRGKNKLSIGIGLGLFCSQLALVTHGLMDSVTWGMVRPAPLVWAIWGLAVASWSVYIGKPDNPTLQSESFSQ